MKFINVCIVLFLMIMMTPVGAKEESEPNRAVVRDIHAVLFNDSIDSSSVFTLGDSNATIAERDRQLAEAKILAQRQKTNSFTNYGTATLVKKDYTNNCVLWAKRQTGISGSIGYGGRQGIQGQVPQVGAIGAEVGTPHAVVIIAIEGDNLRVRESNYYKNWITERVIPKSRIIGYVYT